MILAIRNEHSGVSVNQSLVMGMWRLFHGPIHNSSSSDCVLSLTHSSRSWAMTPTSSLLSILDSASPFFSSSFPAVLSGCSVLPHATVGMSHLDTTLSGPVLLVLVDPKDTLDCRVFNTFIILLLSLFVKEEVADVGGAFPKLWKVCRVLHRPSAAVLGLFSGALSSNVAAILSSFLKCLASRELKMGELSLRLLVALVVCVGPVALTDRRVRMMEPFWET